MLVLALILLRLWIFVDVNVAWYEPTADGEEFDVGSNSHQHDSVKVLTYCHRDLVGRRFHSVWTGQISVVLLPILDGSVSTDTSGPRAPPVVV